MKNNTIIAISIILFFILIIDTYSFKGLKIFISKYDFQNSKNIIYIIYWGITGVIITWLFLIFLNPKLFNEYSNYIYTYFFIGIFILFYIPKIIFSFFILIDDIIYLVKWIFNYPNFKNKGLENLNNPITRIHFLYQLGLTISSIPFFLSIYGMLKGRFDFKVYKKKIVKTNLPNSFSGFKIIQISDAHLGSFFDNYKPINKVIDLINSLKPDVVLFTGDLVNNFAAEAENWISIFKKINSKYGKYSIFGNHDYGDYVKWDNDTLKLKNLNRLKEIHREMGFDLLLNENRIISVNNEEIAIIGVENWGTPPFVQYGDIEKAKNNTENIPFKILLSHDPSHWDEIISKSHKDIDITLSGHTHGAQFGIEIKNIKWSPVQYKYPHWAGLYKFNNQFLYVNRGLGYIGFPGRVGISPEISLLTLIKQV